MRMLRWAWRTAPLVLILAAAGVAGLQASEAEAAERGRTLSRKASVRVAKSQKPRAAPRKEARQQVARKPAVLARPVVEMRSIPDLSARPNAAAAIAASLIGAGLSEPFVTAGPLREAGAHAPPVALPAQLEALPRSSLMRDSPALRLRQAFTQLHRSLPDAPEGGEATPVRLAMLPRLTMPLPIRVPVPSDPLLQPAAPSLAPEQWVEPHMQGDDRLLGRWAKPALPRFYDMVHFASHAPPKCLPAKLKKVIYEVAARVGEVRVISTFRDPSRNRRVGGASRSMHLECRAIDFVVSGRHRDLVAFLRSRPEVGGFSRYPSGSYHIDDGPRRTW